MKRTSYNKKIFTTNEIQDIVNMYVEQQISSVKIGEKYGCSHKVILRLLESQNIDHSWKPKRKYAINEAYFDTIDTPNKAYILGFLYADGSNCLDKCTVTMSLQEEDLDILERIRREIGSEKPLEYLDYTNKNDGGYTYKNQYRLLLFNKHICKTLETIGMIPNKSLKLEFPNIKPELYSHFVRGYYDGDGSVYRQIKNDNNHAVTLTITSTEEFCKRIVDISEKYIGIKTNYYDASCRNGITKVFTVSDRNVVKKFLDWMYQDADLLLKRKHDRYLDYYNLDVNESLIA